MPPAALPLLQVAAEYGGAVSAAGGTGTSGSTIPGGGALANLQSAVAGPGGMLGAGVLVVWLLSRRRGGTGSALRALLGNLLLSAIALAATYGILRWRGML